jgi:hypothetical protein
VYSFVRSCERGGTGAANAKLNVIVVNRTTPAERFMNLVAAS